MSPLSALYGRVTRLRRSWYEHHPERRRSLDHPVISVGNLSLGGSGKTPVAAALARLLLAMGKRPAILSRGYARRDPVPGVVVAGDGDRVLEPVERTGDEPQMLARALDGVPVLVCPDRYLAGRLAERRFGCTVMVLDDGFQHLQLGREVDLLLVDSSDLDEDVIPSGRLREELDAASSADCLVVPGTGDDVLRVSASFDRMPVFRVVNRFAPIRPLDPAAPPVPEGSQVIAVAGIARPQRFFDALRGMGYQVARQLTFPDHHWFTPRDLVRLHAAARATGAAAIVTTEKDAARLSSASSSWAVLPMTAAIEPSDRFDAWLRERL